MLMPGLCLTWTAGVGSLQAQGCPLLCLDVNSPAVLPATPLPHFRGDPRGSRASYPPCQPLAPHWAHVTMLCACRGPWGGGLFRNPLGILRGPWKGTGARGPQAVSVRNPDGWGPAPSALSVLPGSSQGGLAPEGGARGGPVAVHMVASGSTPHRCPQWVLVASVATVSCHWGEPAVL